MERIFDVGCLAACSAPAWRSPIPAASGLRSDPSRRGISSAWPGRTADRNPRAGQEGATPSLLFFAARGFASALAGAGAAAYVRPRRTIPGVAAFPVLRADVQRAARRACQWWPCSCSSTRRRGRFRASDQLSRRDGADDRRLRGDFRHDGCGDALVFQQGGPLAVWRRQSDGKSYRVPASPLSATLREPQFLIFLAVWIGLNDCLVSARADRRRGAAARLAGAYRRLSCRPRSLQRVPGVPGPPDP